MVVVECCVEVLKHDEFDKDVRLHSKEKKKKEEACKVEVFHQMQQEVEFEEILINALASHLKKVLLMKMLKLMLLELLLKLKLQLKIVSEQN